MRPCTYSGSVSLPRHQEDEVFPDLERPEEWEGHGFVSGLRLFVHSEKTGTDSHRELSRLPLARSQRFREPNLHNRPTPAVTLRHLTSRVAADSDLTNPPERRTP